MTMAEQFWADRLDPDRAEGARLPYVGTVAQSVAHIHALVARGYHKTYVEAALWAHLAKHGMAVTS